MLHRSLVAALVLCMLHPAAVAVAQTRPESRPPATPPIRTGAGADSVSAVGTESASAATAAVPGAREHRVPALDWVYVLPTLASPAEDRQRLAELRGRGRFPMLRAPSTLARAEARAATLSPLELRVLAPELRYYWNSDIPFTFNDGPVWAGRGWNVQAMFGFQGTFGPATLTVAPQFLYQRNAEFQFIPFEQSEGESRDPLSSPWYPDRATIDLPSRMGSSRYGELGFGQSSFRVDLGPASIGIATENLWWGPAIRNAVVMSSNAAGFPNLFLRTGRPLGTLLGDLEGQWIVGRLRESRYFDDIGSNNFRALSGLALALRPAFDRNLSLGFTRVVYRVQSDRGFPVDAAFDVFRSVGRPSSRHLVDPLREPGADQLFSLFARWALPAAGFEAYGEWGRYEELASLRDLLTAPHHSQGYTLGLQWVSGSEERNSVRIQAEATFLEPSSTFRERPVVSWYTSRSVPQGWTHLGQPIGAGIGPGASSQWAALDYLVRDRASVGIFANRIRWDNAAFYRIGNGTPAGHDVSMLVGLRGRFAVRGFDLGADLYSGRRMNYLFQNEDMSFDDDRHIDIRNHSLRLTVTPRARP